MLVKYLFWKIATKSGMELLSNTDFNGKFAVRSQWLGIEN